MNDMQKYEETPDRLMNLYDYMAAIGDDNYSDLYDSLDEDVHPKYVADYEEEQELVDEEASKLFSQKSLEQINDRFEPLIYVENDSARIAPVVYDNQKDELLSLDEFAKKLEDYAEMEVEGTGEIYTSSQPIIFSSFSADRNLDPPEYPTAEVHFHGELETSLKDVVEQFYDSLEEINLEIAYHLGKLSEEKGIPANEVAVLAMAQSDQLMTANDYLMPTSPVLHSAYEGVDDHGFNYDVNLDDSLLQKYIMQVEDVISEQGGASNRTVDELEDRFEPQVLVRESGEAITTPLVYDNQENQYITADRVAETLQEMLIPEVHGEITTKSGDTIPFEAHMDVESEAKRIVAQNHRSNTFDLAESLSRVKEAYKDDMPKLKETVMQYKESIHELYDKRQPEPQPEKKSPSIER